MLNFIKAHWGKILIGVVALACLLLFFPGTPQVKGAQVFRDTSLEKLGVVAQAWLNTSVVEHGETANYSIVVYNTGTSELQNLCVSLNAPGFSTPEEKTKCFASVGAATSAGVSG